jgi:hypothetical protein
MGYVYFIGQPDGDDIKIGKTSTSATKRLSQIQVGNSKRLVILGVGFCDNENEIEAYLHEVFKDDRLTGEWFKTSHQLRFIKNFITTWQGLVTKEVVDTAFAACAQLSMVTKPSEDYVRDAICDSVGLKMYRVDVFASKQSLNSSEVRSAIAYYRNWISDMEWIKPNVDKNPIDGKWRMIDMNGAIRVIGSFFETEEWKRIKDERKTPVPFILKRNRALQMEMFDVAS